MTPDMSEIAAFWQMRAARTRDAFKALEYTEVDSAWANVAFAISEGGPSGRALYRSVFETAPDKAERDLFVLEYLEDMGPVGADPEFDAWLASLAAGNAELAEALVEREHRS